MDDMRSFAMNFMQQRMQADPRFAGNPMAKEFMDILQSGDSKRGEQMAANLCQSYGDSKESAFQKARNFFGI